MASIPTVRVKSRNGYTVINESDFDSTQHELYVERVVKENAHEKVQEEKEILPEVAAAPELPSTVAQKTGMPVIPDFSSVPSADHSNLGKKHHKH